MLDESDLLIFVGTVPGDVLTDGFTARQNWDKDNFIVTIDPSLRGRSGPVTRQIIAKPAKFVDDLVRMDLPANDTWAQWTDSLRSIQENWSALPPAEPSAGPAKMATAMANTVRLLSDDAMVTFGAGEHTNWAHRYFPAEKYASLISARNGSMGYSVPSAVAASLEYPGRDVLCIAGDGEFLMNGQEMATAAQYGATPLIIVMDNQEYGTIRTHQELEYPERISGTQLKNPDFALMAQAFGGFGIKVTEDAEVPQAIEQAYQATRSGQFALVHLVVEQRVKAY